jgi:hypothetical protein
MAVWEDHLLPLLTCEDAARLGCTCKALRVVVREHFKDIGEIEITELKAALTTFPHARRVHVRDYSYGLSARGPAPVQWLREGGRGRCLERVTIKTYWYNNEHYQEQLHAALRDGALPLLKVVSMQLDHASHRALLTEGLVAGMHELSLSLKFADNDAAMGPQLAALGLVRQLPALAKLKVSVSQEVNGPVQWPPFIPPPLQALRIGLSSDDRIVNESFLAALPGMLGASGARLKRLEVVLPTDFHMIGDGFIHLGRALRGCSPTLKGLYLSTWSSEPFETRNEAEDHASQVARLRLHWADVLAGVSACRELLMLVLQGCEIEPLFPPGTAFARLTHLEIGEAEREHPPDAGEMGLWELMALGGLPALAKLSVRADGRWGTVEEVRTRVAPAFEAVAGTLTHLQFDKIHFDDWIEDEADVGYELGVAVGKLRRLKDLALDLSCHGRAYHAVAQGLAASGGDRPLPLLWRLLLGLGVQEAADLVASLLLPSVRVFSSYHWESRESLLGMACALRQVGYRHTWVPTYEGDDAQAVLRAIAPCIIPEQIHGYSSPPWTILPHDKSLPDDA